MRVLAAVDRGASKAEMVRLFGVSLAIIRRYVKRRRGPGRWCPGLHQYRVDL